VALLSAPAVPSEQAPAPPVQDWSRRGDLLLAQGRFREAIVEYRAWLRTHPSDAPAHNRLGLALQKTGQEKHARRAYEQAIKVDRCYAEAWNNLGTLDHVRRKYKQAVASYRRAVQCKPEGARLHANLAAAYLDNGDLFQSSRSYSEALRLDPTILEAEAAGVTVATPVAAQRFFDLAKASVLRRDLDAAVKLLLRARALGLQDFAKRVARERAFAELLADPRYAELLR
jgi:Flp pilus assembly protein TadD